MDDFRALLENSYETTKEFQDGDLSRLEFLADYIFDFTTYDTDMGELFACKAIEVCAAINDGKTFDYIKDADNYRWFLLMVNMPFFAKRLEWGTSVRGAWWDHAAQTLESCGIWRGKEQAVSVQFTRDEWMRFIAALVEFAAAHGVAIPSDSVTVSGQESIHGSDLHRRPAERQDAENAGRHEIVSGCGAVDKVRSDADSHVRQTDVARHHARGQDVDGPQRPERPGDSEDGRDAPALQVAAQAVGNAPAAPRAGGAVAGVPVARTPADLLALAKNCGAVTYTNRHLPGEPAVAFGNESWARFCAALGVGVPDVADGWAIDKEGDTIRLIASSGAEVVVAEHDGTMQGRMLFRLARDIAAARGVGVTDHQTFCKDTPP